MGKISPVSGKYIIHASININGTVEKPDIIGAVFGQTEGLLGGELELRELQRSGRIGRIEVNTTNKSGKINGEIIIPSSLDKAETAIIAAALEIIERIGPCNANIKTTKIEDIRISKRNQVVTRAKELLKTMVDDIIPDSQEIAEEVSESVRVMEAVEYGNDKLPAGPAIKDSEEIIVVEGRADVLNLLKYGFKNSIAIEGSSVPKSIIDLSKEKTITVFVDGDRGGDLNIREMVERADVDFVVRAPDGKEVEELTQKEIHKALRGKITPEQYKVEHPHPETSGKNQNNNYKGKDKSKGKYQNYDKNKKNVKNERKSSNDSKKILSDEEKELFKESIQELLGTQGASIMDSSANILGKVPISELPSTLRSLKGSVYAVALDGTADSDIMKSCDDAKVNHLISMKVDANKNKYKVNVIKAGEL
ncbi:MAG: DNA primase DnaG [Nanobdellota archaeon]